MAVPHLPHRSSAAGCLSPVSAILWRVARAPDHGRDRVGVGRQCRWGTVQVSLPVSLRGEALSRAPSGEPAKAALAC